MVPIIPKIWDALIYTRHYEFYFRSTVSSNWSKWWFPSFDTSKKLLQILSRINWCTDKRMYAWEKDFFRNQEFVLLHKNPPTYHRTPEDSSFYSLETILPDDCGYWIPSTWCNRELNLKYYAIEIIWRETITFHIMFIFDVGLSQWTRAVLYSSSLLRQLKRHSLRRGSMGPSSLAPAT